MMRKGRTLRMWPAFVTVGVLATLAIGPFVGPAPSTPTATRLLHGPLVFRVTGTEQLDEETSNAANIRYLVIFKLNRDPRMRLSDDDLARGIDSSRGNYSLLGGLVNIADDVQPSQFGGRSCFYSAVTSDAFPAQLRALNRIPTGRRLNVRLQPLTPSPDGRPTLGKVYVVRATLRRANVYLRQRGAQRALARIGCPRPSGLPGTSRERSRVADDAHEPGAARVAPARDFGMDLALAARPSRWAAPVNLDRDAARARPLFVRVTGTEH